MKKTKLMLALKSLQMNNADKNKLADTIIDIGNNSSGGGNETGVKSYYYRLKEPTKIADSDEIKMMITSMCIGMNGIVNNPKIGNLLTNGFDIIDEKSFPCTAIMFYDIPTYIPANRGDYNYSVKFVGDWANRLIQFMSIFGQNVTYDDAVAMLSQMVEPITEEEFFNLVDVEIE